tara:strand:- start:554 stop:736 length:183 start_codon:yes stop_codon:yes gene_type:complete
LGKILGTEASEFIASNYINELLSAGYGVKRSLRNNKIDNNFFSSKDQYYGNCKYFKKKWQ